MLEKVLALSSVGKNAIHLPIVVPFALAVETFVNRRGFRIFAEEVPLDIKVFGGNVRMIVFKLAHGGKRRAKGVWILMIILVGLAILPE